MVRLRPITNLLLLLLPLAILGFGAYRTVRGAFDYLNSGPRLAGALSVEASRLLGREVRVRDVRLSGSIWNFDVADRVTLTDVVISEPPQFTGTAFSRADRVTVGFSIRQILFATDLSVPYVNDIALSGPEVQIERNPNGRWNFSDLIRTKTGGGRPLTDRLSVINGRLLYADLDFPHIEGAASTALVTRVWGIDANALIRGDKSAAFDVSGRLDPYIGGPFHVVGTFQPAPLAVNAHVSAGALDLPFFGQRFLSRDRGALLAGKSNVDLDVSYAPASASSSSRSAGAAPPSVRFDPSAITVSGSINVANARVVTPRLGAPIEALNGALVLTGASVKADLGATVAGAAIALHGDVYGLVSPHRVGAATVGVYFENSPTISISGTVQHGDYVRLLRLIDLDRSFPFWPLSVRSSLRRAALSGNLTFQVAGSLTAPTASAEGHFDHLRYDDYRGEQITGEAFYADHVIDADVRGNYAGGDAQIRTRIVLDKVGRFEVEVHGRKLMLDRLGIPIRRPLTGSGQIDWAMRGQRGRTPNIAAQVQLFDPSFNHQALHSVYARADTVGRKLVLRTLRAEDAKGFVLSSGTIDLRNYGLDLSVDADELDLGAITRAFPLPAAVTQSLPGQDHAPSAAGGSIEGIAYLRSRLHGTLGDPKLSGVVRTFALQTGQGGAGSSLADKVQANFEISRQQLLVSEGYVYRYPGQLYFFGDVSDPFGVDPNIHMTLRTDSVRPLSIADVLLLGNVDTHDLLVTGTLTADDIVVEGTPGNLTIPAPFTVKLQSPTVNSVPFRDVFATATYGAGTLHLIAAGASTAGGQLSAAGDVSKAGLNLNVSAAGIDLERLGDLLPAESLPGLKGVVDVTAHIEGKPDDLAAAVDKASVKGLEYNGISVGSLTGSATYKGGEVVARNITLTDSTGLEGKVDVPSITFDTKSKEIHTDSPAIITAVPMQRLRQVVQNLPFGQTESGELLLSYLGQASGSINGTVGVSGTVDDPETAIKLNAAGLKFAAFEITELKAAADVNRRGISGSGAQLSFRPLGPSSAGAAAAGAPDATLVLDPFHVVFDGAIEASASAYNIDIGALEPILPPRFQIGVTGAADFVGVSVSGHTASPDLNVSVNLRNLGYAGQVLDRLDISSARIQSPRRAGDRAEGPIIAPGQIEADDIQVEKLDKVGAEVRKYTARAGGAIKGFDWKAPFIPEDASLNLHASLLPDGDQDQNIRVLSMFIPSVVKADTNGTLAITASVTGTRANPDIAGSVKFSIPTFQIPGFSTGLTGINGEFTLKNDRLEVTRFAARSQIFGLKGLPSPKNVGSDFALTGSLPVGFDGATDSTGIHLEVARLPFDETTLPGAKTAKARGTAGINLRFSGSILDPLISGSVDLRDAQATLPSDFGGNNGNGPTLAISPRFDVALNLDPKTVHLVNSQLNVRTGGQITLRGSIPKAGAPLSPSDGIQIKGRLALEDGTLTLPTARFRIQRPSDIAIIYPVVRTGQPTLEVDVSLRATTSIIATSIAGVRKRYEVSVTANGPITGERNQRFATQSGLNLQFTTDPPDLAIGNDALTQRLASVLIGVGPLNQVGQNPGQAIGYALTSVLTGSVIPGSFDRLAADLGFDELAVGYDPIQRLSFTVSRHLIGPFYFTYIRSINAEQQLYDLKVSFRFNSRYQLSYDLDEENVQQLLLEGVWRF